MSTYSVLKGKQWVNPIFTDFGEINRSQLRNIADQNKRRAEEMEAAQKIEGNPNLPLTTAFRCQGSIQDGKVQACAAQDVNLANNCGRRAQATCKCMPMRMATTEERREGKAIYQGQY